VAVTSSRLRSEPRPSVCPIEPPFYKRDLNRPSDNCRCESITFLLDRFLIDTQPGTPTARQSHCRSNEVAPSSYWWRFLCMKKILVALVAVLGFCVVSPAHAGIGFGIPLPFPFLVWTPSSHCGQGHHGSCGTGSRDSDASNRHLDAKAPVEIKGS
jgi:hypothetical protein